MNRTKSMIQRPAGAAATARRLIGATICTGVVMLMAGCATVNAPYHPAELGVHGSDGYSERPLAPDRYRVTFAGDEFTARDKVEGYLLYRSAELTLQQGYDWFRVVERETEREIRRELVPDPLYTPWYGPEYPYWRPSWRYYGRGTGWQAWHPWDVDPFWASRIDMQTVEHFEATAEIVMGRDPMPQGERGVFNARQVIERLGPTIRRPG